METKLGANYIAKNSFAPPIFIFYLLTRNTTQRQKTEIT